MAVFEVTTRITRRYLNNKSKQQLGDMIFELLDENDRLRRQLEGKEKADVRPNPGA